MLACDNDAPDSTGENNYEEEMLSDADEHAPPGYYDSLGKAPDPEPPADEHYRPLYHFTPPSAWMNDPNGLLYHEGEYHLFYQHYPDSNVWGPMHWGHAVSTDLMNWEHLPIALEPYGDPSQWIYSGSAVVDKNNTSGFGTKDNPPLVAIFTLHEEVERKTTRTDFESQGIAYSLDRGRSWTRYEGNPVLPNPGDAKDFRDPKVFWDKKSDGWVMVLAAKDHVEFHGSKDLKSWTKLSEWGKNAPQHYGVWECPELIPMTVEETGEEGYVLLISINRGSANGGSGTFYHTGSWDGKEFTPTREAANSPADSVKWLDYGRDNYAGVTFSNVPEGRTVLLGWMSNWLYAQQVPTYTWRSAMTLPRRLTLHDTDFGRRLRQQPVRETTELRQTTRNLEVTRFEEGVTTFDLSQLPNPGVFELDLEIEMFSASEEIYFDLSNDNGDEFYRFGYTRRAGAGYEFFADRRSSGLTKFNEHFAPERLIKASQWSNEQRIRFHAFFDRTSAEVFFHEGDPVITNLFFPTAPYTKLTVSVAGGRSSADGTTGFDVTKAMLYGY